LIKVFIRSFIITIVIATLATLLTSLLTSSFHQESSALGTSRVLIGHEAIIAMIESFGVWYYLKSLLVMQLIFSVFIFLGCILQGVWFLRSN